MSLNWIDLIIICLVLYELYQGWKAGFIALGITFISFALSLWLAIVLRMPVTQFFSVKFGIAPVWSTILSYVGITLVAQTILVHVFSLIISHFPLKIEKSKVNNALGALVSGVNGITTVAFVLVLLLALPLRGTVRSDIRSSLIGGTIVNMVEKYGGPIKTAVSDVQKTAAKFLTVDPNSKESMPLSISPDAKDLEINDTAERKLLELVNKERKTAGVSELVVDVRIVKVARDHSRDMFMRRYFSHFTPDGKDLGVRLKDGEVPFSEAGENIAFAPDVDMAHQGLLNSPEHKKNMLDPAFHHVGIGVISTNRDGLMVTEDFVN